MFSFLKSHFFLSIRRLHVYPSSTPNPRACVFALTLGGTRGGALTHRTRKNYTSRGDTPDCKTVANLTRWLAPKFHRCINPTSSEICNKSFALSLDTPACLAACKIALIVRGVGVRNASANRCGVHSGSLATSTTLGAGRLRGRSDRRQSGSSDSSTFQTGNDHRRQIGSMGIDGMPRSNGSVDDHTIVLLMLPEN